MAPPTGVWSWPPPTRWAWGCRSWASPPGFGRLLRATRFIRRHSVWVTRTGGVLLVAVGLALLSGVRIEFLNWLRATVGPSQIGI